MRYLLLFLYFFIVLSLYFSLPNRALTFLINESELNGIPFISGGVGINERAFMQKKEGHPYNLKIVFADISGAYLSDVRVIIQAVNGITLFKIVSEGPWLYVGLPIGDYIIRAKYDQKTICREIRVEKNLKTTLFHWQEQII